MTKVKKKVRESVLRWQGKYIEQRILSTTCLAGSILPAEHVVDKILCSIYFPCHLNTMDSNSPDCTAVMDVVIMLYES